MKKYQLPDLNSEQGNAFAILSFVRQALEDNNMKRFVKGYLERATEHNYSTLIGESYQMLEMINKQVEKNEKK